ncbi:carbohydrate-binding module family 18 protein [Canariomyces notabilis]|uniref:Carbohydrate-binding module family 18 protein n=1 Tax=Canariomyces notabilis TaxID=2074819 RepID=A0AAN6T9Z4_9PEZI|nr:carbohydrate-binding module family 18 protein [Canariomyces arenarius]
MRSLTTLGLILTLLPLTALSSPVIPNQAQDVANTNTNPTMEEPATGMMLESREVSPNKTCGLVEAGGNRGYTCPSDASCCSRYGYCGTGDIFCLTTAGCQSRYSNSSAACVAPRNGTTVSIDGTCGMTGAGRNGYRCPANGTTCCSAAGYCGNTTDHCNVNNGCQAAYGTCTGRRTPRNLLELLLLS